MAEAAWWAVEGELIRRWRKREQKEAAEPSINIKVSDSPHNITESLTRSPELTRIMSCRLFDILSLWSLAP
ncbi:hypothetical protein CCACVL1_11186 [Corchorus capsularis]|uniref:Uncharacterized protein n=1 Tax=Corchorus capsularis TaxID=210143 RepID=A0A1R3IMK2_COCAP|nr:hypothetical protein CCACVL1_11186 [Corchorus capsularis]